jgi:Protein of unknown function (DUF2867)
MTTAQADRVVPSRPSRPVSQISLPADARSLSTLARIDYEDAFIVDAGVERTAEEWVRAVLRDPPLGVRARLVSGWLALGLRLGGPRSPQRVLGWKVRQSGPRHVLLAADSWLGLRGELLFRSEPGGGLLFATVLQLNHSAARSVWATITPTHQHVVGALLTHAARREAGR